MKREELFRAMGKRIISQRRELGLTQEKLAEMAELSPQSISTTELGKKALRADNLYKISQALGVSTDYLLTGSSDQTSLSPIEKKLLDLSPDQLTYVEAIMDLCLKLCESAEQQQKESSL
ncbi:MAG: helix-turn-helix transcriptional regulator [Clostridiales bacterium]|nr:helix-turn-helix transcriptional regulator [Clostridiales bacterium]